LWLAGKRAVAPDPETALARCGATTVVCLSQRSEFAEHWPDYAPWLDRHQPQRAVWWPIDDLSAPPLDRILPLLTELRARLDAGDGLLVHCGAGIGRAGTVAVALLQLHGVTATDAIEVVRRHRPMAGPEVGAQRDLIAALDRWIIAPSPHGNDS
jgi:protein-tyrosine phosphatase